MPRSATEEKYRFCLPLKRFSIFIATKLKFIRNSIQFQYDECLANPKSLSSYYNSFLCVLQILFIDFVVFLDHQIYLCIKCADSLTCSPICVSVCHYVSSSFAYVIPCGDLSLNHLVHWFLHKYTHSLCFVFSLSDPLLFVISLPRRLLLLLQERKRDRESLHLGKTDGIRKSDQPWTPTNVFTYTYVADDSFAPNCVNLWYRFSIWLGQMSHPICVRFNNNQWIN